jgi:hypothetical protein
MKIPIWGNAEEIKGANYPFFSVSSNKMIIDPVCAFVDNSKYFPLLVIS